MNLINRKNMTLLSILCVTGPAVAADDDTFRLNGTYLFNTTTKTDNSDIDFEGADGLAGYVGYRVLPWLSLELGGVKFKPIDSSTRGTVTSAGQDVEHEVTGYTAGVRGATSFAGLLDIWLAAGVYSWDSTLNYEITYQNFPGLVRTGSNTHSGEDLYYRVGVTMPIAGNVSLSVESAHFDLNDFFSDPDAGGNADLEQRYVGVGIEYTF